MLLLLLLLLPLHEVPCTGCCLQLLSLECPTLFSQHMIQTASCMHRHAKTGRCL